MSHHEPFPITDDGRDDGLVIAALLIERESLRRMLASSAGALATIGKPVSTRDVRDSYFLFRAIGGEPAMLDDLRRLCAEQGLPIGPESPARVCTLPETPYSQERWDALFGPDVS